MTVYFSVLKSKLALVALSQPLQCASLWELEYKSPGCVPHVRTEAEPGGGGEQNVLLGIFLCVPHTGAGV